MQGLLIFRALLAILLYGFLTVVMVIIWRESTHNTKKSEVSPEAAALIEIDVTKATRRYELRPVTALGRSQDNHVVIDDPFASTHHAIIIWRDQRWWIEDLESHNGTQLNGHPLTAPELLSSGDRIQIGETELQFVLHHQS